MSKNPLFSEDELLELQAQGMKDRDAKLHSEQQKEIKTQQFVALCKKTFFQFAEMAKEYPATAQSVCKPPIMAQLLRYLGPPKKMSLYHLGIPLLSGVSGQHSSLYISEKGDFYHVTNDLHKTARPFRTTPLDDMRSDITGGSGYWEFYAALARLCFKGVGDGPVLHNYYLYEPYTAEEITQNIKQHFMRLLQAK